ncbi:unnamed protein product [Amoebophrya sp. A25]|nr:unnamed protein product [Amoebophrya sp. A25]|eukprot:GSA25T00017136001.1
MSGSSPAGTPRGLVTRSNKRMLRRKNCASRRAAMCTVTALSMSGTASGYKKEKHHEQQSTGQTPAKPRTAVRVPVGGTHLRDIEKLDQSQRTMPGNERARGLDTMASMVAAKKTAAAWTSEREPERQKQALQPAEEAEGAASPAESAEVVSSTSSDLKMIGSSVGSHGQLATEDQGKGRAEPSSESPGSYKDDPTATSIAYTPNGLDVESFLMMKPYYLRGTEARIRQEKSDFPSSTVVNGEES